MCSEFEFNRPPEAPVFEPSEEEFVDALAYIAKIKPIAEKTGICKIRPPAKWQPPFAINIENFRFTPRVQRLNELEALSRIKLNFLDRLARFWELQGYRLRIPNVERKSLDLYGIHKIVHEEGGFEHVCRERRWTFVAVRLGFGASVHKGGITSALRNHYERILYPFDLFEAGVSLEPSKWKDFVENSRMPPKPSAHNSKKSPTPSKRSRRTETKVDEIDYSANKELRKLQFFGPGPKAAVPPLKVDEVKGEDAGLPPDTIAAPGGDGNLVGTEEAKVEEIKSEPKSAEEVTTEPKEATTEPKEATTEPKESTTEPKEATTEPKESTTEPKEATTEPKEEMNEAKEATNEAVSPKATEGETKEARQEEKKEEKEAELPARELSPKSRMSTRMMGRIPDMSATRPRGKGSKSVFVSFEAESKSPAKNIETVDSASKTLDQYVCRVCLSGDREGLLLLCDECDDAYHTFCLVPPLPDVPRGDWRCPQCVAKVCNRPPVEYGFEQSKRQYSLQEFGEMADQFKVNYFKKEIHEVPSEALEFEFWRLLQSLGEDVVVEYGADIHAAEKGSGFPVKTQEDLPEAARPYVDSSWNLNVLPVEDKSVLRFIGIDISGMKIPWCYVGMCFSCFCWHIEDHWSYSINYMHWGEPKTWYGVSSHDADVFEAAMKNHAPELFEQSPDLLHHITTVMNPNILQRDGVPIYRTDQHAGEFVITFPRAYHAGFNNGYNFAEAVNFCPGDWLPMGRLCVEHYASLRRTCVFSHDEVLCKMAGRPASLDADMASAVAAEMEELLGRERQLRQRLLEAGVRNTQREEFELLADDHRMCVCCRTTCFLSAVTCKCGSATRMACPRHADDLCACESSRRTLRFRYSLDELSGMIARLRERVDSFGAWRRQVKAWLRPNRPVPAADAAVKSEVQTKPSLGDLQNHLDEAKRMGYAAKDEKAATLVKRLRGAIQESEHLSRVAKDFFVHERRRATRQRADHPLAKLAVDDFFKFVVAIERLPCQVPDVVQLCNLRNRIESFQAEAKRQLSIERAERDVKLIEELLDFGTAQDVSLPECAELKKLLAREKWLLDVDKLLQEPTSEPDSPVKQEVKEEPADTELGPAGVLLPGAGDVELVQVAELLEAGELLQQRSEVVAAVQRLKNLRMRGVELEEQADRHLASHDGPEVVARFLSEEAAAMEAGSDARLLYLPTVEELRKSLQLARKWYDDYMAQLEGNSSRYPTLNVLEALLDRAQRCRVRVAPKKVDKLDAQVRLARGWLEQTSRFFLKRRSPLSLLELLLPRAPRTFDSSSAPHLLASRPTARSQSKAKASLTPSATGVASAENCAEFTKEMSKENTDCASLYNVMAASELEQVHGLRTINMDKGNSDDEHALYCLCRREQSDFMLQCELCRDWFHAACIALPKVLDKAAALSSLPTKPKGSTTAASDANSGSDTSSSESVGWATRESQVRDLKYLCPRCQRSRRPQLGTIYGLLLSLQQLPVRMPEGEALQLLTERAMAWQDAVHAFLSSGPTDVRHGFAAYARLWSLDLPEELALKLAECAADPQAGQVVIEGPANAPRRVQFRLSEEARATMESLLVQGDLIEVSLEETKWLWQMLQIALPLAVSPSLSPEAAGKRKSDSEGEEEREEKEEEMPPSKMARLQT